MKTMPYLLLVTTCLLMLISCKKSDDASTPVGSKRYMGILYDGKPGPAGATVKNRFVLLDINHDDNADKQFMSVDIVENSGEYKFKMVEGPQPISNYASNWPAGVKSVVSGKSQSHDFLVNAYLKMRTTSSYLVRPYTFQFDSIQKFTPASSVVVPINEMHHPVYAGAMAGKNPDAGVDFWAPGKNDSPGAPTNPNDSMPAYFFYVKFPRVAKPARLYFYFKEGFYTSVISPLGQAIAIDRLLYQPVAGSMKNKVDAVISYEGNTSVLFFFDFDKWEYFTITMPCPAAYGAACGEDIITSAVKSMNTLMEWPAGWGQ